MHGVYTVARSVLRERGRKGGHARAKALSKRLRSQIARKAATARWAMASAKKAKRRKA